MVGKIAKCTGVGFRVYRRFLFNMVLRNTLNVWDSYAHPLLVTCFLVDAVGTRHRWGSTARHVAAG